MNKANLMILAAAMLVGSPCAQFAAGADLCTGAVDPYDIVSEKGRFYATAGRDNELTAEEFNATKSAAGTFRRSFDRWSEMLKFDRDGNKSLDWLEADTYRYAMRKMLLATYDANRDGKFRGPERQTVCKALASGRVRFAVKRSAPPPPPPRPHPENRKGTSQKVAGRKSDKRHNARSSEAPKAGRKSDKRHDAKPSDAAKAAHKEAQLREAQKRRDEHQAKRNIAKFDRNKDGRLDEKETAVRDRYNTEMQKRQAEMQKRKAEMKKRHDDLMRKYDKDGDGKLNGEEKAAAKADYRRAALKRSAVAREAARKKAEESRRRKEVSKFDRNKDGRLDETESAALDKYRAEQKRRMDEYLRKYDTNGDGQVSVEEKARYRQQLAEQKKEKAKPKKDPAKPKKDKSPKKLSRKDRKKDR